MYTKYFKKCSRLDRIVKLELLFQVDEIVWNVPRHAEVDHPVHEVEGQKHDGKDDPTAGRTETYEC